MHRPRSRQPLLVSPLWEAINGVWVCMSSTLHERTENLLLFTTIKWICYYECYCLLLNNEMWSKPWMLFSNKKQYLSLLISSAVPLLISLNTLACVTETKMYTLGFRLYFLLLEGCNLLWPKRLNIMLKVIG